MTDVDPFPDGDFDLLGGDFDLLGEDLLGSPSQDGSLPPSPPTHPGQHHLAYAGGSPLEPYAPQHFAPPITLPSDEPAKPPRQSPLPTPGGTKRRQSDGGAKRAGRKRKQSTEGGLFFPFVQVPQHLAMRKVSKTFPILDACAKTSPDFNPTPQTTASLQLHSRDAVLGELTALSALVRAQRKFLSSTLASLSAHSAAAAVPRRKFKKTLSSAARKWASSIRTAGLKITRAVGSHRGGAPAGGEVPARAPAPQGKACDLEALADLPYSCRTLWRYLALSSVFEVPDAKAFRAVKGGGERTQGEWKLAELIATFRCEGVVKVEARGVGKAAGGGGCGGGRISDMLVFPSPGDGSAFEATAAASAAPVTASPEALRSLPPGTAIAAKIGALQSHLNVLERSNAVALAALVEPVNRERAEAAEREKREAEVERKWAIKRKKEDAAREEEEKRKEEGQKSGALGFLPW